MTSADDAFIAVARSHGIEGVDFSKAAGHFTTVDGVRLHYLDWGGSGTPILFLHGGGQDARTWELVCVQLRGRFRCLAMDLRNHGESDHTEGFLSPADMAGDVKGLLSALGMRRFVLVGMSLGGLAAMAYAARRPEGLQAAVIVDVTPTLRHERRQVTHAFTRTPEFDSLEQAVDHAARLNPYRPKEHLRFSLSHSLKERTDGKWTWKRPHPARQSTLPPEEMRAQAQARFLELWADVPRISCPVLVIHGEHSNATYREDAERLAAAVRNGRVLTIPNSTHTVQGDQPRALAREITRFLET